METFDSDTVSAIKYKLIDKKMHHESFQLRVLRQVPGDGLCWIWAIIALVGVLPNIVNKTDGFTRRLCNCFKTACTNFVNTHPNACQEVVKVMGRKKKKEGGYIRKLNSKATQTALREELAPLDHNSDAWSTPLVLSLLAAVLNVNIVIWEVGKSFRIGDSYTKTYHRVVVRGFAKGRFTTQSLDPTNLPIHDHTQFLNVLYYGGECATSGHYTPLFRNAVLQHKQLPATLRMALHDLRTFASRQKVYRKKMANPHQQNPPSTPPKPETKPCKTKSETKSEEEDEETKSETKSPPKPFKQPSTAIMMTIKRETFLAGQQKTKDFQTTIATLQDKVSTLETLNASQVLNLVLVQANFEAQLSIMQKELSLAQSKNKIRNARKRKRGKRKNKCS